MSASPWALLRMSAASSSASVRMSPTRLPKSAKLAASGGLLLDLRAGGLELAHLGRELGDALLVLARLLEEVGDVPVDVGGFVAAPDDPERRLAAVVGHLLLALGWVGGGRIVGRRLRSSVGRVWVQVRRGPG